MKSIIEHTLGLTNKLDYDGKPVVIGEKYYVYTNQEYVYLVTGDSHSDNIELVACAFARSGGTVLGLRHSCLAKKLSKNRFDTQK